VALISRFWGTRLRSPSELDEELLELELLLELLLELEEVLRGLLCSFFITLFSGLLRLFGLLSRLFLGGLGLRALRLLGLGLLLLSIFLLRSGLGLLFIIRLFGGVAVLRLGGVRVRLLLTGDRSFLIGVLTLLLGGDLYGDRRRTGALGLLGEGDLLIGDLLIERVSPGDDLLALKSEVRISLGRLIGDKDFLRRLGDKRSCTGFGGGGSRGCFSTFLGTVLVIGDLDFSLPLRIGLGFLVSGLLLTTNFGILASNSLSRSSQIFFKILERLRDEGSEASGSKRSPCRFFSCDVS